MMSFVYYWKILISSDENVLYKLHLVIFKHTPKIVGRIYIFH